MVGTLEQREKLVDARVKLFSVWETCMHPGRDEKILTSWNGLMLAAFVEAIVQAPSIPIHKCCQTFL